MSVVIKSVYSVTSTLCQAVTHVILRDLTNYYWDKERAELEQRQDVSSIQEENISARQTGDIVALTVKTEEIKDEIKESVIGSKLNYKGGKINIERIIDKNNPRLEKEEEIKTPSTCNKQSYTVEALGDNIEQKFQDKKELSKDLEVLREDICRENFILMKCIDSDTTDTVLLNPKGNIEPEDECGIHLLLEKPSYPLQTVDDVSTMRNLTDVEDNYREIISGECIENLHKTSNEIQDDKVDENSNEVFPVFEEYTLSEHQSIGNDQCKRSPDEKCNPDESNLNKEQKILNENLQQCCSVKVKTEPPQSANENIGVLLLNASPEDGLANTNSKSHDELSETTGLIETFSDNDSNCYDEDWVRKFLSNTPECATKQENKISDVHTESCECSKTHSCLLALDCDDQIEMNAELLTDEQLQSVETGSVSDWLYSVSPAICLLPANDIIYATPEELNGLNNDQETIKKHKPEFKPNENMLRNFYVKQWLDNSKYYYSKCLPKYHGYGDFL